MVLPLSHPDAAVPSIAGAKAANIARTARSGLPTLPGFVLTTSGTARGLDDAAVSDALRDAWEAIGGDRRPVVVRSSSTIEDAGSSSMAGRFTSVLDVTTWDGFLAAVADVVASADAVRDTAGVRRPIAVLVQQQLRTELGGVMFGVDPVTGDRDHIVVEAVGSRPDTLVGGTATADHYVLSHRGRVLARTLAGATAPLDRRVRRQLVALARRTEEVFDCPQDVEWAVDLDGTLWLLQSRPVTAVASTDGGCPIVLGPGPVAETFPAPLRPLEADMWIVPLREGLVRALTATAAVDRAALDRSPVATTVGGWAAVDLGLLGLAAGHTPLRRRISPRAITRRLGSAWRVGRLRVALPHLASTVVATVDRDLAAVPHPDGLSGRQLVELVRRARAELATVHAYEVLCGMLLHGERSPASAPLLALAAVYDGRVAGWTDDEIVERAPVALALCPPALGSPPALPTSLPDPHVDRSATVDDLGCRDALRLRARWLQELQCRAVDALARRLAAGRQVGDPALVHHLGLDELAALAEGRPAPPDLGRRALVPPGAPLPPAFRVGAAGEVHEVRRHHRPDATGLPAGGGRGAGVVRHRVLPGSEPGAEGRPVLVTRHLEPQLAPLLPQLAGLVSETGSALSHLAILARETGVPTVVAVDGALHRFAPGTRIVVDGTAGTVEIIEHVASNPAGEHEAVPA